MTDKRDIASATPTSRDVRQGDYIPADAPPPKKKRRFIGFFMFLLLMLTIIAGLWFGRQWYDSLLVRLEQNKTVHNDESVVKSGVRSQVREQVPLVYRQKDGQVIRVLADADAYSDFVTRYVEELEHARLQLQSKQKQRLSAALDNVFVPMQQRVKRFADWYFAYPTTYKLLWQATTSVTNHVLAIEAVSLNDAVSHDLEMYLQEQYEKIVLRPEITNSRLETAYRDALAQAQRSYINSLAGLEADFQSFVRQQTSHLDVAPEDSHMELDWRSQFHKLHLGEYEKSPEGAASGGLLALGGAAAGKSIGGAAGKAVFSKLSAPFVTKAVAAGTGGAAGLLGGPVGSLVGIAGGLGVDYLLNEGVELTQRENFIADVNDALDATQSEWEAAMQQAQAEAIDVWFNDSIQLVPRYKN
jgi:hypothetical protein